MERPRITVTFRQSELGFTLIELLLYVSIAAVVLLAIAFFTSLLLEARIHNQVIGEVEEQGRQTMLFITQIVRNATTVTLPAVGGSGTQLSVTVFNAAKNPTVVDVVGGTLRLTEGGAAAVPLINNRIMVTNFTVRNLSRIGTPGTVQITLTLSHVNTTGRREYSYQQTFIASASFH